MRQIALDTETTGLSHEDGDRLIEIGLVELIDRQFTGKTLHYYLNPERSVQIDATAIHNLTDDFLLDKPLFKEIAEELITFICDSELIIHNAKFDLGFLNFELGLIKHPKKVEEYALVTDTLVLARTKYPGQRNTLDALCKRLNIDLSTRTQGHGALIDAQLLAKMYLAMTGGQMELFDNLDQTDAHQAASLNRLTHTPKKLASEEELLEHQKMLKMLVNPLWSEENG